MLPEHIIYDEMKREREGEWQPEALRLPLHIPHYDTEEHGEEADDDTNRRGVLIIDMNDGYAIVD